MGHLGRQQLVINPSHDATVFDEGVYALHTYVPSVNLGEKLKQLLIKHGSFKEVEHKISKYNLNKHKDARVGKWVTKAYLIDKCGYMKLLVLQLYKLHASIIIKTASDPVAYRATRGRWPITPSCGLLRES